MPKTRRSKRNVLENASLESIAKYIKDHEGKKHHVYFI